MLILNSNKRTQSDIVEKFEYGSFFSVFFEKQIHPMLIMYSAQLYGMRERVRDSHNLSVLLDGAPVVQI